MKILVLADKEDPSLWDYYTKEKVKDIDLIISCGDLSSAYLEFLVTMSNKTLLYVRGNHDTNYDMKPPLGCIDIDDKVYNYKGLRILGLGGSMKYGDKKDMYSETEMKKRIRKLSGTLSFTNGFDLLITHAPALGYGDLEDLPHLGFDCFNDLLNQYHPYMMCYGHVHKEYGDFQRTLQHPSQTILITTYQSYVIDIPEDKYPKKGQTGSFFYDWYIVHKKG